MTKVVRGLERVLLAVLRRWTAVTTALLGLFWFGATLVPRTGDHATTSWSFQIYHLFCHQLAERSLWCPWGRMALCARCVAIYGAVFVVGMVYCGIRRFRRPRRYRYLMVCLTPILLDGLTQWLGLRTSTNLLRWLTGSLAGVGMAVLGYPLLDQVMREATAGRSLTDHLKNEAARARVHIEVDEDDLLPSAQQ